MTDTALEHDLVRETEVAAARVWRTIVWDDSINLMSYVTYVFMTYFAMTREVAEQCMLQVHNEGRAIVSSGGREQMERDVVAMHEYGLHATLEQDQ